MKKRTGPNRRAVAIFAPAMATACRCSRDAAAKKSWRRRLDAPANPVLLVSAARAEVHPMSSEIHLLGKTVATHHVIIRAPTAGRVVGMKLTTGDSVRKGQVVAHVVNREIEAAEAGLAVARKIDPADAPGLSASVGRYDRSRRVEYRWSRRTRASSRSRRSPAARWSPTSIRWSI